MLINTRHVSAILFTFLILITSCSENPGGVEKGRDSGSSPASDGSILKVVEPDVTIVTPGTKISQLVGDYDRERDQPTQNRTNSRYQLWGTDLGVPFQHDGRTYLLFGDTIGPPGGDAIAYTTDTNPEDGLALDFVEDENGIYKPVTIPGVSQGSFEVPSEGISVGGNMYIYHTTDHSEQNVMGRSVVAKSVDDGQTFTKLYDLSTDKFINVSAVKVSSDEWKMLPKNKNKGEGLVLFGSGRYRQSNVYLAHQRASKIENPAQIRYFAGIHDNSGKPRWSPKEEDAVALFDQPCVGEFSVSYNTFIDRWIMLYNCGNPRGINMRTAKFPWGPWTEPQVLFHPWDDGGYCSFIHTSWAFDQCDSVHDPGRENEWGGEYGPYQFEHLATGSNRSTTIYFTMSTWNPYTVVMMKAGLQYKDI